MITNIKDQLTRDEGNSLVPYKDSMGNWSIGVGHYLGSSVPPMFLNGISELTSNNLFTTDLNTTNQHLLSYFPWCTKLSPVYFGVLQNMGFNLGVAGLTQFHEFLGYVQSGWWLKAAADLRTTKVYKELTNRYERLAKQLETGIWQ